MADTRRDPRLCLENLQLWLSKAEELLSEEVPNSAALAALGISGFTLASYIQRLGLRPTGTVREAVDVLLVAAPLMQAYAELHIALWAAGRGSVPWPEGDCVSAVRRACAEIVRELGIHTTAWERELHASNPEVPRA